MSESPKNEQNLTPLKRALLTLDRMQKKLDNHEQKSKEPIALVGMGCRAPGDVADPDSLWRLLRDGVDAITETPKERWDLDAYFDEDQAAPGKMYTRFGGFLRDVDKFDAAFFGISPREAAAMDPQQRILIETSWEALEHAGQTREKLMESRTGVYVGACFNEYSKLHLYSDDPARIDAYSFTGTAISVLAGRLSYLLGLQGPSLAVDTACSSSLVTTHLACQALRAGECDLALAGGVNLILSPEVTIYFCKAGAMAPDGRCKTFDAAANGYVRGEGCGMIVLKRLSDALADGDNILALIRGSAVNQDGRSNGLTAPNGPSQVRVIRDALAAGDVKPYEVGYVEAHGTGTPLGDPIEVRALNTVYGEGRKKNSPLTIGSIKTNVGHLEGAAGVLGLIKVVLSLQNKQIPPHLHFKSLNPMISLDDAPAEIPTTLQAWAGDDGKRMAGVSSFGISGTNAHVVLQESPVFSAQSQMSGLKEGKLNTDLLTISAHSLEALKALAKKYTDFVETVIDDDAVLKNLCYSASVRRTHQRHRLALAVKNKSDLVQKLGAFLTDEQAPGVVFDEADLEREHKIVFVFPGQGGQWFGMARELLREEPVFRASMENCEIVLKKFVDWSLLEQLQLEEGKSRLHEIDVVQPTLFAIYVSLAALWKSWGITPDAVVGHSMGETAAAAVSGGLSLEDAAKIICRRSKLLRRTSGKGAMAVVELSLNEAENALRGVEEKLSVAVSNSSRSTVIAGDPDELDKLLEKLDADGVFCRKIKVDVASHSPQMDPLIDDLLEALDGLEPKKAEIPMYSTVLTQVIDGTELNAEYWVNNLRQPVLLSKVINQLADDGHNIFIELSPHPVLLPAIQQELQERDAACTTIASMRRNEPEQEIMHTALATLYTSGYDVDWNVFYPKPGKVISLPLYPWQRERFWFDGQFAAKGKKKISGNGKLQHPFLDFHLQAGHQRGAHVWQAEISTGYFPYLADHRVRDAVVFPAAGFVELALAGARELFQEQGFTLENIAIEKALFLPENPEEGVQLQLVIRKSEDSARFTILSQSKGGDDWETHVRGKVKISESGAIDVHRERPVSFPRRRESSSVDALKDSRLRGNDEECAASSFGSNLETLKSKSQNHLSKTAHYETMHHRNLPYGAHFQAVNQIWQTDDVSLAEIALAESLQKDLGEYIAHPAALDAAFQLLEALVPADQNGYRSDEPYLPAKIENCCVYDELKPNQPLFATLKNLTFSENPGAFVTADIALVNENGDVLLEANGLTLERLARDEKHALASLQYQIEWLEKPRVEDESKEFALQRVFLVFKNNHAASNHLVQKLEDDRRKIITVTAGTEFKQTDNNFEINPGNPEDWRRLLETIQQENPTSLLETIFLWSITDAQGSAASSENVWQAQQDGAESVLHLTKAITSFENPPETRLWLVTNGAQPVEKQSSSASIAHAPLWGLSAVLANEHPELNCKRIDFSQQSDDVENANFLQEIASEDHEDQIVLRGEKRFVARLVQKPVEGAKTTDESENRILANGRPFRAHVSEPGVIDNLHFQSFSPSDPGADEVQIEVHAAGLNFLNVMSALGIYPGFENGVGPLGIECAGVVGKIGENVKNVKPGDEVLAYALDCMATHATTHTALVMPKPKNLNFEQAATIPGVFLTAHYALNKLAHLQKGERVLIHSATGGVGLAAIQLAKLAGAEIFATAGTSEKREFLTSLGIKYVMDSRSLDFAEQIMEFTNGEGVDVVLNSLSGEAIAAGLSALRPYGRFVEIGKADIYQDSEIGLSPFKKSLSYFTVDFERMPRERPEYVGRLLAEIMALFENGKLEPLPLKTYAADNLAEAFRFMAQAKHIGKLAISFENKNIDIAPDPSQRFAEGSWLITGGLGALGLKTAEWLVGNGARHLALTSRGKPSDEAKQKISALQSGGAQVEIMQADVADEAQTAALLGRIRETLPPLKGVVHAAGLLADSTIAQMDVERFREAMRPKVLGAWNLHRQTQNDPLEYFVLFSSATAILGSAGQSNYAAGNAFMDALAHHRRVKDLPGLSVNWGTWSEIGLAAAQENRGARMEDRGLGSISPEEGVKSLDLLLENETVQAGVMRFNAAKWSAFYTAAQDAPFLSQLEKTEAFVGAEQEGSDDAENMRQKLQSAAPGRKRRKALEDHLQQQISKVLKIAPDRIKLTSPLKTLGLDSLMALELRNRLEASLEVKLRATIFWNFPTISVLAPELAKLMEIPLEENAEDIQESESENGVSEASVSEDDLTDLLVEIEGLSDEEAQELL